MVTSTVAHAWFKRGKGASSKRSYDCTAMVPAQEPRVVSTAVAFPPYKYSQEEVLDAFLSRHELTPQDADWVTRVFRATGIKTCSFFLPKERLFEKMSRVQYVEYVRSGLFQLGVEAARKAIRDWGGDVQDITHIIWGTMTGTIHAPTMDTYLARELGLRADIRRLNVESMGCLTGFRCLALASELAAARPGNTVLTVVCDIRSALGNQLTAHAAGAPVDRANVIASCLFRDSGGAAIVAVPQQQQQHAAPQAAPALPSSWRRHARLARAVAPAEAGRGSGPGQALLPQYDIIDSRSLLVPGSEHLVQYGEREGESIHLFIAKELPDRVKQALPNLVKELLAPHGLTPNDCCFAVHTGGPKILEKTAAALGVNADSMQASWEVMEAQGNLSGASNLVVLDRVRRMAGSGQGIYAAKRHCICISMGPGVGIETILLRRA